MKTTDPSLLPRLRETVKRLKSNFGEISPERKELLAQLTAYVRGKTRAGENINLNFICTHNSRRSHIAQIWAQTAAHYYSVVGLHAFSGGTEATAFNPRAVEAMKDAGFEIEKISAGDNPQYTVRFSVDGAPIHAFSKKYNDPFNPPTDFAAVMTCSHADDNCPVVSGASRRISIHYDDPKDFDNTPDEKKKYRDRVNEIGCEMLYAFSQLNTQG